MLLWRLCHPRDVSLPLKWPSLDQEVMVERDFYTRFFHDKKWLGGLHADGPQRKFVVLGQPGIGKTAFGWWLVAQLLRSSRTVVYSSNSAKRGTPQTWHIMSFIGVQPLKSSQTLALLRACLRNRLSCIFATAGRCHKVMLTSPDPDMWRWYVEKEFADTAYFPLYNGPELEALRAAEYGDALTRDVLALRRKAWGDAPRQLFSLNQRAVRDSILCALSNADLAVLQRAKSDVEVSMSRPTDETPHSLFLLHARETLKPGSVTFRSDAVARRVLRTLAAHQYSALLCGMQQLLESRTTKGIAGNLFEIAAIDSLSRGGSFVCRPLAAGAQASTTSVDAAGAMTMAPTVFRKSASVSFDSLETIVNGCQRSLWALQTNRFVPDALNFASINSIEEGLRLCQITTTRSKHGLTVTSGKCSKQGLAAIAKALLPLMGKLRWGSKNAYLEVYFVVSEGSGASFTLQELEFFAEKGNSKKAAARTGAKSTKPRTAKACGPTWSQSPKQSQ